MAVYWKRAIVWLKLYRLQVMKNDYIATVDSVAPTVKPRLILQFRLTANLGFIDLQIRAAHLTFIVRDPLN